MTSATTSNHSETEKSNGGADNDHHHSAKKVELTLGKWLGEGGFSAIYELATLKDNNDDHWIVAPPSAPAPTTASPKHRRGQSAFGSFASPRRKNSNTNNNNTAGGGHHHHHKHQSMGGGTMGDLPPLLQSVELDYLSDALLQQDDSKMAQQETEKAEQQQQGTTGTSNTPPTTQRPRRTSWASSSPSSSKPQQQQQPPDTASKPRYVVKCLKGRVLQQQGEMLQRGLKDMQLEADTLRKLSHPHILPLRAMGTMSLEDFEYSKDKNQKKEQEDDDSSSSSSSSKEKNDYDTYTNHNKKDKDNNNKDNTPAASFQRPNRFPILILDRLVETLEDKLEYWETKHQRRSSFVGKFVTHRKHDKNAFYAQERLQYIWNIGSAMQYLHQKQIIYRDLKPENVGFDRWEQLKILDFGLARDLSTVGAQDSKTKNGLYKLTGLTGSARYMAPEVAKEQPYNETCDVYAFAIVIWEIVALKQPYAKYNVNKMFQQVYNAPHVRPNLEEICSNQHSHRGDDGEHSLEWLADLLHNMWTSAILERYSMDQVMSVLREHVKELQLEGGADQEQAATSFQ